MRRRLAPLLIAATATLAAQANVAPPPEPEAPSPLAPPPEPVPPLAPPPAATHRPGRRAAAAGDEMMHSNAMRGSR